MGSTGSSATNARLFSELGFEAQIIAKVDRDFELELMKKQKDGKRSLDFIFNPSKNNFGDKYGLLTSLLPGEDYCYPKGQYNDVNPKGGKGDEPIVTNPERTDFNAPDKSIKLINYINELADLYNSTDIMLPMGCDFTYENAKSNFNNMDMQMKYINEHYKEANLKL